MSVVISGGHDRMVCQYKRICKEYNCKAKVFTQMSAKLGKQVGSPDLVVLFTNTVSHKFMNPYKKCKCYSEALFCIIKSERQSSLVADRKDTK